MKKLQTVNNEIAKINYTLKTYELSKRKEAKLLADRKKLRKQRKEMNGK